MGMHYNPGLVKALEENQVREESEVSGEKTGWGMLLVRGTTNSSKHGVRKRK